jgi:D-alanyl-D-alanine carboxypeptidase
MRSKIIIGIAFMAFHTASCQQEEIALPSLGTCTSEYTDHPLHEAYSELLNTYQKSTLAPGSIMAVKQVGEEPWIGAKGYSNLAHKTAMTVCTPFRTGSVTKMYTAALVLKLAEKGFFSLDDKVSTHLPGLKSKINGVEEISIRQLLNHTSGLSHPTDDNLEYQLGLINNPEYFARLSSRQRLTRFLYHKPLKHTPGSRTHYSNAGYWLLEWVVMSATERPFTESLQEHIFTPLGLNETYLSRKEDKNVSRGYNSSGPHLQDVTRWDAADSDGDPAAGIISTAADLLVFGEGLFSGKLLNSASLASMIAIFEDPHCMDCGYGLGIEKWTLGPYTGFGMNGSSLGVDANLLYFPEQQTTLVLFSNYGGGNRKDILEAVLNRSKEK